MDSSKYFSLKLFSNMKGSTAIFLVTLTVISVSGQSTTDSVLGEERPITIIRPHLDSEYKPDIPLLYGYRSCGGEGNLISIRLEGCDPNSICQFPADNKPRLWQVEFVPSADSSQLGMREFVFVGGTPKLLYDIQVPSSEAKMGQNIILGGLASVSMDMKGIKVTTQYSIYDIENNNLEVCAEADYELV